MRNYKTTFALIAIFAFAFASCNQDAPQKYDLNYPTGVLLPKDTAGVVSTTTEEVPTIDLTSGVADTTVDAPELSQDIQIVISNSGVMISAPNFSSQSPMDVNRLTLQRDANGNLMRIEMDGVVFYGEKFTRNRNYLYLDANTIMVQRGNTLNGLIEDHRAMGYDVSRKSLAKCNPGILNESLKVGQYVKLACD